MQNALDLLLGGSINVDRPQKEVKIKRLSNEEVDFKLTCEAITMDDFKHIQEMNTKIVGNRKEIDEIGVQLMMITYGVREFNEKLPENKEQLKAIKKQYGVADIAKFVNKILLPGEIAMLAMTITDVSGFDGDLVEEIKNK